MASESLDENDLGRLIDAIKAALSQRTYEEVEALLHQLPSKLQSDRLDEYQKAHLAGAVEKCLERASGENDLSRVQVLLQLWRLETLGSLPSAGQLLSPLVAAAVHGHAAVVQYLLYHGAEVFPTVPGLTLNAAVDIDLRPVFQAFVKHGWDINTRAHTNDPILIFILNRQPLLLWFLENGADPNAFSTTSRFGVTPLEAAANKSTTEVIDMLLEHGAKLDASYPLHHAATRPEPADGSSIAMMDYFLNLGVDINALQFENHPERTMDSDRDLGTALHWIAGEGRTDRLKYLIQRGADIHRKSSQGRSPLDWAKSARRRARNPVLVAFLKSLYVSAEPT
ncbi:hypothetical protein BP6252_07301 [Coleophoma cylindrospora]|uniref:Uncharacterized protein n=1 Tax=Coleophoma cylindrospora TaxID=1849047 RepID=A0A3D8RHM3_9HELO|nr:hypothetical protein BP6252_07301 [Coleophoma cylindrospora]